MVGSDFHFLHGCGSGFFSICIQLGFRIRIPNTDTDLDPGVRIILVGRTLTNNSRWLKVIQKSETILHIFAGIRHSKPRNSDPDPNFVENAVRMRINRSGSATLSDFFATYEIDVIYVYVYDKNAVLRIRIRDPVPF
jgi:hypothetical protein